MYKTGYCYFRFSGDKEKNKKIKLHRYLMGCHKSTFPLIDHINRNPLDNRKSNLRIANYKLNVYNSNVGKNNISEEKGVYFSKERNRWHGAVQVNGVRKYTKYTKTKEECIVITRELRQRMYEKYLKTLDDKFKQDW